MTDWGAHHIDIAQWAIDSSARRDHGHGRSIPTVADGYNVAIDFNVNLSLCQRRHDDGRGHGRNGILFTGDQGRMFVNRGTDLRHAGRRIEERIRWLAKTGRFTTYDNLERPARAGKLDAIINHMGNFFDCVETRQHARLGCRKSTPQCQHLSPGQHLDASGQATEVGPRKRNVP